jgi:pyruvate formate lyase activating enzyme
MADTVGDRNTGKKTSARGMVFDIQRYSLHDGPGIRTVVFLKGCPLKCEWCCNPESIARGPHVTFNPKICLGDRRCTEVCPTGARSIERYRVEDCIFCGKCVEVCPSGALELMGRPMTVDEVVEEAEKDRLFYESSGGGVTLSGGEVLAQREFALVLMKEFRNRFLHITVETSGHGPWEWVRDIVDACDLVLYDLKHMDSDLHKKYTGVANDLILENALKVAKRKEGMVFRIPLVGGVNTGRENIEAVAQFAMEAGVQEIHLLPYHSLGESKYGKLGRQYTSCGFTPDDSMVQDIKQVIELHGIEVKIGG